jgi:hypothetical protein
MSSTFLKVPPLLNSFLDNSELHPERSPGYQCTAPRFLIPEDPNYREYDILLNLKIVFLLGLKKEEPRAGKRKPIEESVDEEDTKQGDSPSANGANSESFIQNGEPMLTSPVKEQKETVIRANNAQQITSLLTTFNISLQANKNNGGVRKNEDGSGKPGETKRKKQVKTVCTALFLNNNEIRTIQGLRNILINVVFQPDNLKWVDLSYNYL